MSKNLEIVVGVTEKATSVKAENVVLVNEHDTKLNAKTIENEVINYLHNINERDLKNASQTIKNINGKNKIETHKLRIPESKFQNRLLSLIYQKNVSFDNISFWIKIALAKYGKEGSVEIQRDIDSILIGVKSCNEAIVSLEAKLEKEYKKDFIWLATNNSADARYQIDILAGVENMESSIKVLHLVQVKTTTLDKDSIQNITEAHQNYLDNLPQLIGKLNKKEAPLLTPKYEGSAN